MNLNASEPAPTPRVVPVISNVNTAFRMPVYLAEPERSPISLLADLEEEPLLRGELDHLAWLLERAARHGQVLIAQADGTITINGVASTRVVEAGVEIALR